MSSSTSPARPTGTGGINAAPRPIRLVLGDPSALFRCGCRRLLEREPDLRVAEEASTGQEAVRAATRLRPDIVLLELDPVDRDGTAGAAIILAIRPTPVVLVTRHARREVVRSAARAGARAYVLKHNDIRALIATIRRVARGEHLLTQPHLHRLLRELERSAAKLPVVESAEGLTERELDLLGWLARGASNRQIATALDVKEKTVRNYVWRLAEKLGVRNRTEAALYALRTGLA